MADQTAFDFATGLGRAPDDNVVLCSACGREIVVHGFTHGKVTSEYRDENGRCFECNRRGGDGAG